MVYDIFYSMKHHIQSILLPLLKLVPRRILRWGTWLRATKFRAGVVGVIYNSSGEVLLVRMTYRNPPQWELPGGILERGEPAVAALTREIREETGYEIDRARVLGVDIYASPPNIDIFLAARILGGTFESSAEVSEAIFVTNVQDFVLPREWQAIERHLQAFNPTGVKLTQR